MSFAIFREVILFLSACAFAWLYVGVVKPHDPTGRVRYVLACLWSLMTLTGIYWATLLLIPALSTPYEPLSSYNPQTVFIFYLLVALLPEVSVLGMIVSDLVRFRIALKAREQEITDPSCIA
jgi:hypothetical protein